MSETTVQQPQSPEAVDCLIEELVGFCERWELAKKRGIAPRSTREAIVCICRDIVELSSPRPPSDGGMT